MRIVSDSNKKISTLQTLLFSVTATTTRTAGTRIRRAAQVFGQRLRHHGNRTMERPSGKSVRTASSLYHFRLQAKRVSKKVFWLSISIKTCLWQDISFSFIKIQFAGRELRLAVRFEDRQTLELCSRKGSAGWAEATLQIFKKLIRFRKSVVSTEFSVTRWTGTEIFLCGMLFTSLTDESDDCCNKLFRLLFKVEAFSSAAELASWSKNMAFSFSVR